MNENQTVKSRDGGYTSHTRQQKFYVNTYLLKLWFQVTTLWQLKKMFKGSIMIFHASIEGNRLLGTYFISTRLTGVIASCRNADIDSIIVHAWWCSTICSSCSSKIHEQRFSGTTDSTKQTNSEAWSLSWFKFLRVLPLGTTKVDCLCYKSQ